MTKNNSQCYENIYLDIIIKLGGKLQNIANVFIYFVKDT